MTYNDQVLDCAKNIRLLVLDVDGVLTDGSLYYGPDGQDWKAFNTLDGHGLKLLQRNGIKVAIVTGRSSAAVSRRAQELGITLLIQGREDKWIALQEVLQDEPVASEHIACMGDDLPDLHIMRRVALALTVPNAHPVVRQHAHWQSHARGGEGAVREACDMILRAQDKYDSTIAAFIDQ